MKEGKTKAYIAEAIGVTERTIYREIRRGTVTLRNSDLSDRTQYFYDVAQRKYDEKQKNKLGFLKIGNNHKLANLVETLIVDERMSPYAVLEYAKKEDIEVNICLRTLYNYINGNLFLRLSRSSLIYKKKVKTPKKERKAFIKAWWRKYRKKSRCNK